MRLDHASFDQVSKSQGATEEIVSHWLGKGQERRKACQTEDAHGDAKNLACSLRRVKSGAELFLDENSCRVPPLVILSKSPQLSPRKGGTSVMRYEFNPLSQAMIGAFQDCLLSARPR
jgi:hypothetical protein